MGLPGMLVYVGLCVLLGYVGREKKFGFVGNFLASLFFTPLLGFVFYLLQHDAVTAEVKRVVK
jgi:hypothetical protein